MGADQLFLRPWPLEALGGVVVFRSDDEVQPFEQLTPIYVIGLTEHPHSANGPLAAASLNRPALQHLLSVRPGLRVDGVRPSVAALAGRLDASWLADEVVLYSGQAGTSVRKRMRQYYKTPLGAKRPHAGGWCLKTLSMLDELWVHWAATRESDTCEGDAQRVRDEHLHRLGSDAARPRTCRAGRQPPGRIRSHQATRHDRRDRRRGATRRHREVLVGGIIATS